MERGSASSASSGGTNCVQVCSVQHTVSSYLRPTRVISRRDKADFSRMWGGWLGRFCLYSRWGEGALEAGYCANVSSARGVLAVYPGRSRSRSSKSSRRSSIGAISTPQKPNPRRPCPVSLARGISRSAYLRTLHGGESAGIQRTILEIVWMARITRTILAYGVFRLSWNPGTPVPTCNGGEPWNHGPEAATAAAAAFQNQKCPI